MSETRQPDPQAAHPGDVGRRVMLRRQELGLSREEVAARAGMAPGYLRYVEEQPADVDIAGLIRLAGALETTIDRLRGAEAGTPPGRSGPAAAPRLEELTPDECMDRLAAQRVGRVAVSTDAGPEVYPVNYAVVEDTIVYRTAPTAAPAAAVGHDVAFEVDQVDDALSQGWSVLVTGRAEQIGDGNQGKHPPAGSEPQPWAGGDRTMWVRIVPDGLTGRRVRAA